RCAHAAPISCLRRTAGRCCRCRVFPIEASLNLVSLALGSVYAEIRRIFCCSSHPRKLHSLLRICPTHGCADPGGRIQARELEVPARAAKTPDLVLRTPTNWTYVLFFGCLGLLHLTIAT